MMEKTKKPKGKVSHIGKKSPADKYTTPNVYTVAAEITSEEKEFLPVSCTNSPYSEVCVVVSTVTGEQAYKLNHRATTVLDCGFKIKLPAGFRIKAEANRSWAQRGLFVSHAYLEDDSLKLVVTNIGQETPLVISHKANVAHIWAEPVYLFDWNLK